MDYSEVLVLVEFAPISVSDDPNDDYIFRVEILRRASFQSEFRVRVFRREVFKLKPPTFDVKSKWQNKKITFEDVVLDWWLIKAISVEDAFSKIMEEIEYAFPFLSEKGAVMPRYDEIVKVIDLEPISIPETNSYYRFRIEIIKKNGSQGRFRARTYRFERFELQPSYPIIDGKPKYERVAPVILIEDESSIFRDIEGETIDEVIQKILQVADKLKSRSIEDEIDLP